MSRRDSIKTFVNSTIIFRLQYNQTDTAGKYYNLSELRIQWNQKEELKKTVNRQRYPESLVDVQSQCIEFFLLIVRPFGEPVR